VKWLKEKLTAAYNWLKSVLEAPESAGGGLSSKRLFGLTCLVMAITVSLRGAEYSNSLAVWLAAASSVFIAQAASGS
jgi:hypothetical protein